MTKFKYVGDVVREVDASFEATGLRVAGGSVNYSTGGFMLALASTDGDRAGEAFCALPNGGWSRIDYFPSHIDGEDTERLPNLSLSTIAGFGRTIFPTLKPTDLSDLGINVPQTDTRKMKTMYVVNDSQADELLVVRGIVEGHPELPIGEADLHTYDIRRPGVMSSPLLPNGPSIELPVILDSRSVDYCVTVRT